MKKTLLAAALLAGFAGVAQAETSVTLYGILDAGFGFQNVSGDGISSQSKLGVINNMQNYSRWGLRGSEDLGDGLSAVFTLESGFQVADGLLLQGGRLFGRQATLGLANNAWGQLDIGRQTNIASKYFMSVDPFTESFAVSGMGTAFSTANMTRYDNMLMFQSPVLDGLQFGIGYAFNTNDLDTANTGFASASNQRAWTLGVRYMNGPLNLVASYDQLKRSDAVTPSSTTGTGTRINSWILGGTYDFEVLKLALAFGQTNGGWIQGTPLTGAFGSASPDAALSVNNTSELVSLNATTFSNDFRARQYLVGITAPLQQGTNLLFSWQMVNPNSGSLYLQAPLSDSKNNMTIWSLGLTHDLSPRTSVYGDISLTHGYGFAANVKSTFAGLGVRHMF